MAQNLLAGFILQYATLVAINQLILGHLGHKKNNQILLNTPAFFLKTLTFFFSPSAHCMFSYPLWDFASN